MITRVTGILESLEQHAAVLVPTGAIGAADGGIAYEVLIPAYLSALLTIGAPSVSAGPAGQEGGLLGRVITLHTLHYFEGVNQGSSFVPRLIGFGSTSERDFFELLTTVKGLGNRRALRALAIEPGQVARAIVERDTRVLQRLPEIGPKLAEAVVHELKSKAEAYVALRARVDVGAVAGRMNLVAPSALPATAVIETKEAVRSNPQTSSPVAGGGSDGGNGSKGKRRVRAAPNGEGAGAGVDAPPVQTTPPVRQTVQALIALGEQPMEAERMVARAVDRAASAGELSRVCDAAGLLTAAYQSR